MNNLQDNFIEEIKEVMKKYDIHISQWSTMYENYNVYCFENLIGSIDVSLEQIYKTIHSGENNEI